jgi:DNA-binding MarR family transcriptional regulator
MRTFFQEAQQAPLSATLSVEGGDAVRIGKDHPQPLERPKAYLTPFPTVPPNIRQQSVSDKALKISYFFSILDEMGKREYLGEFELTVILALLRVGGDAYGVPIAREIEDICGREAGIASVYAALERLERKGFVNSRKGEPTPERGGRAKRYFHVTALGLRQVRKTQKTLIRLWRGLPQFDGGEA